MIERCQKNKSIENKRPPSTVQGITDGGIIRDFFLTKLKVKRNTAPRPARQKAINVGDIISIPSIFTNTGEKLMQKAPKESLAIPRLVGIDIISESGLLKEEKKVQISIPASGIRPPQSNR